MLQFLFNHLSPKQIYVFKRTQWLEADSDRKTTDHDILVILESVLEELQTHVWAEDAGLIEAKVH